MKDFLILFLWKQKPKSIGVEAFFVNEQGFWELKEYINMVEFLFIKTIDLTIPVSDIYEDVEFSSEKN